METLSRTDLLAVALAIAIHNEMFYRVNSLNSTLAFVISIHIEKFWRLNSLGSNAEALILPDCSSASFS